jgi:GAF domain-containing protein
MIPVSTGATWIGALLMENRSKNLFSSEQARVCRNVADQAALVIGSQILLTHARQATAREHALVNTSSAMSSSLNPEYLLNSVLDTLQEIIPHDAANILTIEGGEAGALVIRGYAAKGIDEDALLKLRIPIDAVDNLKTMRDQRKPVVISNTEDYADWVETQETSWVKSYAGAPIFVGDNLIGFLNLDSGTAGFFTQEDATLLQAFADQFGLAYQNAQLFQKSRLRAQREQILGNIAGKLQTVSTMDDVLETATRSIQELLGEYDVSLRLNEPERQFLSNTSDEGRE